MPELEANSSEVINLEFDENYILDNDFSLLKENMKNNNSKLEMIKNLILKEYILIK